MDSLHTEFLLLSELFVNETPLTVSASKVYLAKLALLRASDLFGYTEVCFTLRFTEQIDCNQSERNPTHTISRQGDG